MDAPVVDADTEHAVDSDEDDARWHCVLCDGVIAEASDAMTVPGHPAVEPHLNPHGMVFMVRTFHTARIHVHGPMVPAFTWYPGYVWRVGTCPQCREHLGWMYLRVVGDGPQQFVGLIDGRITLR